MLIKNHRLDEIECLRAVAILFTLFHHAPAYLFVLPNQFFNDVYAVATFWGGVDLFFVISGFVIMRSFSEHLQLSKVSYWRSAGAFWIRRMWRIFPSAWLWLGIYLLCTIYVNYTGAFGNITQNIKDSAAAFWQYANFFGLNCGVGRKMQCGPNGIYWSLSLEEQFYILLPLVIFCFKKFLVPFLFLAVASQFFLLRPDWSFGWAVRTDALILGVLLAIWSQKLSYTRLQPRFLNQNPWLKLIFIPLCLAAMAILPATPNKIQAGTGLLAVVCAGLVYLASLDQGYILKDSWFRKLLVWIGSRSYSIYLIHIIAFRLAYEIIYQLTPAGFRFSPADSWLLASIAFPLLFIASELNYRFVEQPFRKYGLLLAKKFAADTNSKLLSEKN